MLAVLLAMATHITALRVAQSGAATFPRAAHIRTSARETLRNHFQRTIARGGPEVPLCVEDFFGFWKGFYSLKPGFYYISIG